MKIVPDTSIVIDGRLKKFLAEHDVTEVVLPELVIAETEYIANKGTRIGITWLEELNEIRNYCLEQSITLNYYGERTRDYKDMDDKIRSIAEEITQYTSLRGSMAKTADILLLTRPDFTIFDEMRRT
jgi:predicted PilT family ATPase